MAKTRTPGAFALRRRSAKKAAVAEIEATLAVIAKARREPSHRERVFILQAIRALSCGVYDLARLDIVFATAPSRPRRAKLPRDPIYKEFDLARLRRALREAALQPVEPYPNRNAGGLADMVRPFPAFSSVVVTAGEARSRLP